MRVASALAVIVALPALCANSKIEAPCGSVLNAAAKALPAIGFGIESSDRVGGFMKLGWTKGTSRSYVATRDVKALTTLHGFWATAGYDVFKVESASLTAIPVDGGCDTTFMITYAGYKSAGGWFVLPSNDSFEVKVVAELAKYSGLQGRDAVAVAAPPPPPTQEARLAVPPKMAMLKITSDPSGAEIEIDGNYQGSTPLSTSPADGEHSIKITKRGFNQWERKLVVKPGDDRTVHAELVAAPVDPNRPKIIGLN